MSKIAVIVMSDPKSGGEEALGRLLNALITATDAKLRGDDVQVLFQGAGSRWASVIVDPAHPAHPLFRSVESCIVGVSSGCADVFGATDDVRASGLPLLREAEIPGTSGVPSIASRIADGRHVIVF